MIRRGRGVFEGAGIVLFLDLVVVIQIFALYFVLIKLNMCFVHFFLHNCCFAIKKQVCVYVSSSAEPCREWTGQQNELCPT